MAINNKQGQTFDVTFYCYLSANCDNEGTSGGNSNSATTTLDYSVNGGGSWTTINTITASVSGGSPTPQYDTKTGTTTITLSGIADVTQIIFNSSIECSSGGDGRAGDVFVRIDNVTPDFGMTTIICDNQYNSACSGNTTSCTI